MSHVPIKSAAIAVWMLVMALSSAAADSVPMSQWRACTVAEADFQKTVLPPGPAWVFVGHPLNSFKEAKLFSHAGPVAYYMHFPMKPLPEKASPLLILNGIPEGSVVLLGGKRLVETTQRQKGSDEFSVERWYPLPDGVLRTGQKDLNNMEIWAPSIRKSPDHSLEPVSKIVFENPDVLAERDRQRRLRSLYFHEVADTEDPYVARHW